VNSVIDNIAQEGYVGAKQRGTYINRREQGQLSVYRLPSTMNHSQRERGAMGSSEYAILIDTLCGIAGAMVLVPPLFYLFRPWATRRDKLFANLDEGSLMLYYRQFYPSETHNVTGVKADFKKYFNRHYGRRHYSPPIVLLTVLTVISAVAAARTLAVWQNVAPHKYALPWIVVSALAGGFVWVISDLIDRLRRRDFTISDVYNSVFRILIAAPFGWAFAQVVKTDVGVPLAFLLGAFPTTTLFRIARRLASSRLGISEDSDAGTFELEKLQSITKTNAERFYDEGISTIVQLAYTDPIALTIRTNFDFNYVIDCISQSLLWIYFEDKTHALVIYSLRGAQEAASLMKSLSEASTQLQATATLNAVAGALNLTPASVQTTLQQISDDPYSQFISSIWH
jgi:hypothetical protein